MDSRKRKRLEVAGFVVRSATDFLGLTPEEEALVEMKAALGSQVRRWRTRARLTQAALAKRLRSSQSRVAKLEAGDPSVSLDLLVRASIAAGASKREVAKALVAPSGQAAG
jgi:predicted XRE-type DNA-binding protein